MLAGRGPLYISCQVQIPSQGGWHPAIGFSAFFVYVRKIIKSCPECRPKRTGAYNFGKVITISPTTCG